jgi:hypothetical protein
VVVFLAAAPATVKLFTMPGIMTRRRQELPEDGWSRGRATTPDAAS